MYGTRATGSSDQGSPAEGTAGYVLLRRGASFCHLRQLSLPWQESKGAAPKEAKGELAEEEEREPAVLGGTGETPVAEEMDKDVSEGEGPPPEDEEMNALRGVVQASS